MTVSLLTKVGNHDGAGRLSARERKLAFNDRTASPLADSAARAVEGDPDGFRAALNDIPAAIYVADTQGTITYFNDACIEAVGRQPEIGVDKWCVSWKLYTPDGEAMPHDRCPMAIAIGRSHVQHD